MAVFLFFTAWEHQCFSDLKKIHRQIYSGGHTDVYFDTYAERPLDQVDYLEQIFPPYRFLQSAATTQAGRGALMLAFP